MGSRETSQCNRLKIYQGSLIEQEPTLLQKVLEQKIMKVLERTSLPLSLPQGICFQLLAHFFMELPFLTTNIFLSYSQTSFLSLSIRNNRTIWLFDFTSCVLVYACKIHEGNFASKNKANVQEIMPYSNLNAVTYLLTGCPRHNVSLCGGTTQAQLAQALSCHDSAAAKLLLAAVATVVS